MGLLEMRNRKKVVDVAIKKKDNGKKKERGCTIRLFETNNL
jgi:hypothetical protein